MIAMSRIAEPRNPARAPAQQFYLGGVSYQRTDDDVIERLQEQVGFLRRSALAYDKGERSEAQRMATTVRILCHDRGQSRALLGQLGLLDQLRFVDSIPEVAQSTGEDAVDPAVDNADGSWHTVTVFSSPLAPMSGDPRGFVAQLDRAMPRSRKSFDHWWSTVVAEVPEYRLTRADVVLALANQDGGAHVDPEITNAAYAAISREGAFGKLTVRGADGQETVVDVNPVLEIMRQLAYEVDETLRDVVGS